jgi:SAM-dependent methyltransferase
MFPSWNPSQPEITDLISRYDAYTLKRLPVGKQEVLELFARYRNRKTMRAVLALRENASILDDHEIDVLLLTVHWEMQRLAEEFYHGHRVWALLRHIVAAIREVGVHETLHIIDVGCGIGYTIRWLAAKIPLADYNIELTGMDLSATLIAEANRLASAEHLPCQFFQADAFSGEHSNHILLSTGVIHHFRGNALLEFLRHHEQSETKAFLHFDFQPWVLAPFGSWFFHYPPHAYRDSTPRRCPLYRPCARCPHVD